MRRTGAVGITFLLLGCGGDGEARRTVRVGWQPYLGSLPIVLAIEEGFFGREGLEVELAELRVLEVPFALASGQVDVASTVLNVNLFAAIQRGADIGIAAGTTFHDSGACPAHGLVIRPGLFGEGPLPGPEALPGLRVAARHMTAMEYSVDLLLRQAPGPRTFVDPVPIPAESHFAALSSGSVDAVATSEPEITRFATQGARLWLPFSRADPDGDFGVLVFARRLLSEDPDLGARFRRAFLAGVARYSEGKTERNLTVAQRNLDLDEPILGAICWPAFRLDGGLNFDSVDDFQRWALERGYLESVVPRARYWAATRQLSGVALPQQQDAKDDHPGR